jgi:hypothetical protein
MGHCTVCGESWPLSEKRVGHCTGFHKMFNSDYSFDKHRVDFKCLDPEEVGLVMSEKGYWATKPDSYCPWNMPESPLKHLNILEKV